jgi:hypothetical protein
MRERPTLMGRVIATGPIHAKLMAVKYNEENTIRINPRIYSAHPSTNKSNHGTRSNVTITTN